MWRLTRAQLKHRWQRPLAIALLVGFGAALIEWFSLGRRPHEWWTVTPMVIFAGAIMCNWWADFESRQKRPALLVTFPLSVRSIALSNALVPVLMFVPVVSSALIIGIATGSLNTVDEFSALAVWTLLLLDLLFIVQLWVELKPRMARSSFGKSVHYLLPVLLGGLVGVFLALSRVVADNQTFAQTALRWMSPTLGVAALMAALLMSIATVVLFIRRDDYVS